MMLESATIATDNLPEDQSIDPTHHAVTIIHSHSVAATEFNYALIARLRREAKIQLPWCDEYAKMISGMNATSGKSKDLLAQVSRCAALIHRINNASYYDREISEADILEYHERKPPLLRQLLGKMGKNAKIETPFHARMGCNILIGDSYINHSSTFHDCAPIIIGDRCLIGPKVTFITEGHGTDVAARRAGMQFAYPIEVGNDVWIGANVTVLAGVKIGDGCTIGAGSVVTKDIEPFSVAVGVPCRVIRKVADPGPHVAPTGVVELVKEKDVAAVQTETDNNKNLVVVTVEEVDPVEKFDPVEKVDTVEEDNMEYQMSPGLHQAILDAGEAVPSDIDDDQNGDGKASANTPVKLRN